MEKKLEYTHDKLCFKNSGKTTTLRGDVVKMITDYKFVTSDLPNAKLIIGNVDEMHFEIHS